MDLDRINAIIQEFIMRQYRPTNDETATAIGEKQYELRGWTLHRHGGKPIENFSSYYWLPPNYTTSPVASRALRGKLAERWDWILGKGATVPEEPPCGFALYDKPYDDTAEQVYAAEADTEELAVALCAAKTLENLLIAASQAQKGVK
jgi:hypothetical protein